MYIKTLAFTAGMSVMAAEMAASRLLAPYFGTSLFVWTNLIGVVMIALTAGYYLGGKLADKRPDAKLLSWISLGAGIYLGILPFISKPVMEISQKAFTTGSTTVFYASLIGTVLLIAIPMFLLGMVNPMAIRISTKKVGKVGSVAGSIAGISTAGSIIGTFLPALLTIPLLGTQKTFLVFGLILIVVSSFGIAKKVLFILLLLLPLWIINPNIKADAGVIDERESMYNYIQVLQKDGTNALKLNEGHAIHSMYNPDVFFTNSVWDYFLIMPLETDAKNALIIGLAGGTISRAYNQYYPEIAVEGVEIDPEIIKVGKEYFGLAEQSTKIILMDGRTYLDSINTKYDIIIVDAYKQPYIPFHLTTEEFFELSKQHLSDDGIFGINVGAIEGSRIMNMITSTMASVFDYVYVIDVPKTFNHVVIAADRELLTTTSNTAPDVAISSIWRYSKRTAKLAKINSEILTDDKAPVELLTDFMILKYASE